MSSPLRLFLDLGDTFTKGIVTGVGQPRRLRFPSVVARQLVVSASEPAGLLLDEAHGLPRPTDFDPVSYPRVRSYPGGASLVSEIRSGGHPLAGARFAGWLAAAYGADRQVLGREPTLEHIEALVHKALILLAASHVPLEEHIEIVFVVDIGAKAGAIQRFAAASPRRITTELWSLLASQRRRVNVTAEARVLDAAACALACAPAELQVEQAERVLVLDIGYTRTKLAVISAAGCEHQEALDHLGVADCVRRVLRDEQDQGLVEDEFAVIRALESSQSCIEVAGRRFDVKGSLSEARQALAQELARVARRIVTDRYNNRGELCRAAAILGGGAALVGRSLARRLEADDLPLRPAWAAADASFLLVDGARRVLERSA